MKRFKRSFSSLPHLASLILEGKLVCAPTDTLYGLLGSILKREAVEKVFKIKGRELSKPLIVLFSSLDEAVEFGVVIDDGLKERLQKITPAPITFVLPVRRGSLLWEIFKREDVAIRIPNDEFLLELIRRSSPLFAPSANPSGLEPARNCGECYDYFKEHSEEIVCVEGEARGLPSTIVKIEGDRIEIIREGAVKKSEVEEALKGGRDGS